MFIGFFYLQVDEGGATNDISIRIWVSPALTNCYGEHEDVYRKWMMVYQDMPQHILQWNVKGITTKKLTLYLGHLILKLTGTVLKVVVKERERKNLGRRPKGSRYPKKSDGTETEKEKWTPMGDQRGINFVKSMGVAKCNTFTDRRYVMEWYREIFP